MSQIAVSIVIPVYNTERYLRECLDSVINQTLKNIEIICVDDGSTDSSSYILDSYAMKDNRIKVIHKANAGYGHTMNVGFLAAKGKYVGIVESDDYIALDMMEILYDTIEREKTDFVKSDYSFFWGEDEKRVLENAPLLVDKMLYNSRLGKEEIKKVFRGYIANWSGIYNRDFILKNKILHNETAGASYQDLGFFFQIMMNAESGYLISKDFYRYRQDNPNSSINNRGKVFCIFDEYNFIYEKINKDAKTKREYLSIYQLIRLSSCFFNLKRVSRKYKLEFLERTKREFEESEKSGELDISYFEEWEKDEIYSIMDNPNLYYENAMKGPDKLYEQLQDIKHIVIYGAGAKGSEALGNLRGHLNEYTTIRYAVSDRNPQSKTKNGLPLISIYDLKEESNQAVILAVTNKYKDEMLEVLQELHFSKIVTM